MYILNILNVHYFCTECTLYNIMYTQNKNNVYPLNIMYIICVLNLNSGNKQSTLAGLEGPATVTATAAVAGDLPATIPSPDATVPASSTSRFRPERQSEHRNEDWNPLVDLFPEIYSGRASPPSQNGDGAEAIHRKPESSSPIARITALEWRNLAELEECHTLVGQFVGKRPPLQEIRSQLRTSLRIEGEVQIGSLDKRHIHLRFSLENDRRRAWLRNQMMIDGARLWLGRWTPDWRPNCDSPLSLPIGRLVELDTATSRKSRPSVARVRLEIDVTRPLAGEIWIEYKDIDGSVRGFWQILVPARIPTYCGDCGRYGHKAEQCRRFVGEPPPARQNMQKNKAQEPIMKMGKDGPQSVCRNVRENPSQDPICVAAHKEYDCTPGVCRNASKGLGLSLSEQERIVQEAILEAAENIMEEVADKVVKEGCSDAKWVDLVEFDDQNGTSGKMQNPKKDSGLKQGMEVDDQDGISEKAESNRSSSGQGKGLSKNQIRREKRKLSMARKAGNKKRGENLEKEKSESLMELEVWIDKVKEMVNKEEAEVIDEARSEVLQFFKHAQLELGEERFHEREDDLVQKANKVFLDKLGNIQGNFRSLVEGMGSPMKGRREVSGPDKSESPTQSLESSGSSKNQDNNHRSFVVKKNEWEEAKMEIAAHMSKLKKELGMQEFERRKEEIVEKTKELYLDKLKELSKAHR